ncbi:RluA family pseudouridine synthase [Roseiconus lacunae]|uniref:RluA family pseudouridine synthase n=1 Tax=Roseiconus lacunae TaxID=2605694 RepID=A0ABT7PKX9_9BACT|nr:RluA family pseudouridine synthase [Roseiconus lacunae]MDM4017162.1 RluA family pseudouridine synthase [Roseiconus lacunae]WRQ51261.1 RluA family pseudouridine synthase [Stieleria sp. HD01]
MNHPPKNTATKTDSKSSDSLSPIEVIWRCDNAIAINKPSGLATQAPAGIESVESRLIAQLSRQDAYLAFPHRLDRAVSGVLLVALTKRAARLLSGQFASRKTTKHYVAIVQGQAMLDEVWEDYLCKTKGKPRTEVVEQNSEGAKLASTIVRTIDMDANRDQTRLELQPLTGRMHQLRVQTSSRGFPIVGDDLYGGRAIPVEQVKPPLVDRILLHAAKLEFFNPTSGKRESVVASCSF